MWIVYTYAEYCSCFGLHPKPISEFNTTAVLLHNTLGWEVTHTARIVVNRSDLVVRAPNGTLLPSQLNPLPPYAPESDRASGINFFPETTNSLGFRAPVYSTGYALYFTVVLPPTSLSTVFIEIDRVNAVMGTLTNLTETSQLENDALRLQFNSQTGMLQVC